MNKIINKSSYLLVILLGFGLFFSSCEKDVENTQQTQVENIKNYEVINIDYENVFEIVKSQVGQEEIIIDLSSLNTDWIFTMKEENVYTEDAKIQQEENGQIRDGSPTNAYFLSGTDKAKNLSLMIAREGKLYFEYAKDDKLFIVEALSEHLTNADKNEYLFYTSEDLLFERNNSCELTAQDEKTGNAPFNTKEITPDRIAKICAVSEASWWAKEGSNHQAAIEDIVFLGGARYWFYSDYNLKSEIDYIVSYTGTNGYNMVPTPSTSVQAIDTWHSLGNATNWIQKKDANVLFTGRNNITNSSGTAIIGGRAKDFGTVCGTPTDSYMLVCHQNHQYTEHQIFAHELGHLLNATHHSQNGPMESNINNATSVNFYWKAENQMDVYLNPNNNSCLFN